jgi:RNA polymerase sigma factor (sigma-70 family)
MRTSATLRVIPKSEPPLNEPEHLSKAIEELITRFGLALQGAIGRFHMSRVEADELVQEVRIRLWRMLADGRHQQIPASYFKKLVRSAAVDLERQRRAHALPSADDAPAAPEYDCLSIACRGRSPLEELEDKELAASIALAVDTLREPRGLVVRLYLSGHDRVAIAELLGWTEAKTRNLLYRGLEDLRARLARMGIAP